MTPEENIWYIQQRYEYLHLTAEQAAAIHRFEEEVNEENRYSCTNTH